MRTFQEYRENKNDEKLAELIVEAGLDSAKFCDYLLELATHCETEEELLNEFWGGLKQLGQSAWQGVKNNFAPAMQQAGQMAQQAGQWVGDQWQKGSGHYCQLRACRSGRNTH